MIGVILLQQSKAVQGTEIEHAERWQWFNQMGKGREVEGYIHGGDRNKWLC